MEDVVQDTFIYLWNNKKTIKIKTSINSYLYRIVYNKLMDSYKKQKKYDENLVDYYQNALITVIENHNEEGGEKKTEKLQKCIEKLPKRCKTIFYQKKIIGLTNKQIANDLDISLKTVEGHITRAFKLLKVCVTKNA